MNTVAIFGRVFSLRVAQKTFRDRHFYCDTSNLKISFGIRARRDSFLSLSRERRDGAEQGLLQDRQRRR